VRTELVGHSTRRPLLDALRWTLDDAEEAILCSAFVKRAGVHLIEPQLRALGQHARLVATSVFGGASTQLAMAALATTGTRLRVANPGRGTFHPKIYVARKADSVRALIGSANLTGGLVTNVETAVACEGSADEQLLDDAWATATAYWSLQGAQTWQPVAAEGDEESFERSLQAMLSEEIVRDPVFVTLARAQANRVVGIDRSGLWIETDASKRKRLPPQHVPAWMFQLAWDYLKSHGSLTNRHLLASDGLNVKRSSAVMAILARLPGVQIVGRSPVEVAIRLPLTAAGDPYPRTGAGASIAAESAAHAHRRPSTESR
jgi:HKD family nuclease